MTRYHPHPYAYLTFCGISASIGFFFYGYYLGQLNNISQLLPCNLLVQGASPYDSVSPFLGLYLPQCIPMSTIQFSFANAVLSLGGIIGAYIFGQVSELFGRLYSLRLQSIPYIIAPIILSFANSYAWLLIGRIIAGIGIGGSGTSVPLYLNEIAPSHLRGPFGGLSATAIAAGFAGASLTGYLFGSAATEWRWIMAIPFIIAVLQALLLMKCVESPIWVHLHDDDNQKCMLIYNQLGQTPTPQDTAGTVPTQIESGLPSPALRQSNNAVSNRVSIIHFLTKPDHRRSLFILAIAHSSQQMCGINVYFAYSFFILTMVLSRESTGLFYLIFAFSQIPINFIPGLIVDRFGRRPLLLGSMIGMGISSTVLTLSVVYDILILTLVMFVAAVVMFGFGLSNIPFILVPEVVEPSAASSASIVSQFINNFSKFIILFVFPILLNKVGVYTFLFFTGYLAVAASLLAVLLPETKGRSPVDVVNEMRAL